MRIIYILWICIELGDKLISAQSAQVRSSYIWPLAFIHNKTIPVIPPLQVHGNVKLAEDGLLLDGHNAWLDAGDFTGSCICYPDQCSIGLSLALRIKFDASARSFVFDTNSKFILDSGGHNGDGISIYTRNGEIFFEVGSKNSMWKVSTVLNAEKWHFILVTWSEDEGMKVFVDGPLIGQSRTPTKSNATPSVTSSHVVIGKGNFEAQDTFGRFLIDLVALFDSYVPSGKIYLSYAYSEPKREGNIRYVNARFINSADFRLSIYPDRGERRLKGYHLSAKASTLLEFVLREGPLPTGMRFELRNKDTEMILKHRESSNLLVLSSDDSQMITDIQIRQDGKIFVSVNSLGINPNYELSTLKGETNIQPTVSEKPENVYHPSSLSTKLKPTSHHVEGQMAPIKVSEGQAAPLVVSGVATQKNTSSFEIKQSVTPNSLSSSTQTGMNINQLRDNASSLSQDARTSRPGTYSMLGTGKESYGLKNVNNETKMYRKNVSANALGTGNMALSSELPHEDQLGSSTNYTKSFNATNWPVTTIAQLNSSQVNKNSYPTGSQFSAVIPGKSYSGGNRTDSANGSRTNFLNETTQFVSQPINNKDYGSEKLKLPPRGENETLNKIPSSIQDKAVGTSIPTESSKTALHISNSSHIPPSFSSPPNNGTNLFNNSNTSFNSSSFDGDATVTNLTGKGGYSFMQKEHAALKPELFKEYYERKLPNSPSNTYEKYIKSYYKDSGKTQQYATNLEPQNATSSVEWTDNSGPDLPAAYAPTTEDTAPGITKHNSDFASRHTVGNLDKKEKGDAVRDLTGLSVSKTLSPSRLWTKEVRGGDGKGYAYLIAPNSQGREMENTVGTLPKLETSNGLAGFALTLTRINSNEISTAPGLKCHGNIENADGGIKFDGMTGWIDAGDFTGTFLADPLLSKNGFGVGLKILLDASIQGYDAPRFILDTGGLSGKGISIYMESGKVTAVVATGKDMWSIETRVDLDEWFYYIMSWRPKTGLTVYINSAKYMDAPRPTTIVENPGDGSHLVIGTSVSHRSLSFASFTISMLDIFEEPVEVLSLVDYSTPILKPQNVWMFSSIKEQRIASNPKMFVHGNVEEVRGVIVFDGENAFLSYEGNDLEEVINSPEVSANGVTLAVKVKLDKEATKEYLEERFIVDSGGWLGYGFSLFVMEGQLYGVLGYQGNIWRAVVTLNGSDTSSWLFIVLTFRRDIGLAMYVNGALMGFEKKAKYFVDEFKPSDSLTVGCSVLRSSVSFAKFQLSVIAFFLEYLHVDEIVKMSPPLIIKPYFDWFLMMTKNGVTLTTPPLKVKGGVDTTENGLHFDGKQSWLDAGDLEESADENAEIICEHFAKDIACPRGQIIRVTYANYGRTSDIPCQGKRTYTVTNCVSSTSKAVAQQLCNGRRSCRLKALNNVWGNTCYGVVKYLEIRYQCIGIIREGNNKVGAHFLTNPDLATDGLTIALKVKLEDITSSYHDPHYILDSGGHEGSGVSVYVMKDLLHCEIGTGAQMWMVKNKVATSEWYYILITWRQDQGLALYINGVLRDVAVQPVSPPSGGGGGAFSGTLVLGKSSLESQESHASFFITLLTVLRTWISKSESFRMFAMYVGRTISSALEASVNEQELAIICEYQTKKIECPADQTIRILNVTWGRTSKDPCPWGQHLATNCRSPTAFVVASQVCDGKNFCELTAKTSEWGNPCPGIVKYLEIKYLCNEKLTSGTAMSTLYIGDEDPGSLVIP